MTTRRTYECNLCHGPARDGNARGFIFGHKRVEWTTVQQAENHLCDNCINSLMAAFQDRGIQEQFTAEAARLRVAAQRVCAEAAATSDAMHVMVTREAVGLLRLVMSNHITQGGDA